LDGDASIDRKPRRMILGVVPRGPRAVWALSAIVLVFAAWLALTLSDLGAVADAVELRWWGLAPAFYVAESAVVHIRFRKDAHSFSMSEIPLVVGLFFASPVDLVIGQLVGNLVVLSTNRRQPPIKLVFNVAQFALQTTVAIVMFRWISGATGVGAAGWLGAMAGALAALFVADVLINAAITLTGGTIGTRDVLGVLLVSAAAAVMNTSLGLTAVTLLNADPAAAWLALVPPIVLFLAYRAYVSQQEEKGRLESLFDMTRELHGRPQLEGALLSAVRHARAMINAEYVEIVLMPEGRDHKVLVTRAGPRSEEMVLQAALLDPCYSELSTGRAGRSLVGPDVQPLTTESPRVVIEHALAAALELNGGTIGFFWAVNKLGDIGSFTNEDLKLLVSIAQQTTVSVENSRLEDSLAQVTELKEQLEALVRSKDDFVAAVSHELRTPLTAVVGLAHELRDQTEGSDDELSEFMDIIAEQSSELANLVEDLLVAARSDTGNLHVVPRPLSLVAELELALAGVPSAARDVTIDVDPLIEVLADPIRLRQIVRNLVTNAQRYGGRDIAISAVAAGAATRIAVSDDGDGVPPGLEEAIFNRYQRAAASATQPGSVGLGLAVSRQLAELMGGTLEYSRTGGRSIFSLSLPSGR